MKIRVFLLISLWPLGVSARETTRSSKDVDATDVTESGIHAAVTTVQGADRGDGRLAYYGFSSSHVGYGYEAPATIRVVNNGGIAFGAHGVEGGIDNSVTGGVRAPFGKNHGLVVRGGFEGNFFGNKYLWDSRLELPEFQLGYQWLVPGKVVDFAMKGGYILLGRHNAGDAGERRTDGSLEWGGVGTIHFKNLDLRADYSRIYPRHAGNTVNQVGYAFCGNRKPFTVCTDFRYEVGQVYLPDAQLHDSRVTYVGLTFGFELEKKKKKP